MTITLQNNQTKHPLNTDNIQLLAEFLGEQLHKLAPELEWNDISLLLIDDETIAITNAEYFDKPRPTDVITFRYDPVPGIEEGLDGDLLINCDRVMQEGPNHNGIQHELALYIAHGFDHLSGAEDNTDEKRAAMRATELAWLAEAETRGLLAHLIGAE